MFGALLTVLTVRFLMPGLTPNQVATDWASRLAASTTKIKAGVARVQTSPGALAARQKTVWAANVAAAKTKWASRLAALPLSTWQQDMNTKGIPRIASGAQAAQTKFANVMSQLLPYIDRTVASLPARGSLEQNIARSAAFIRGMSQFKMSGS